MNGSDSFGGVPVERLEERRDELLNRGAGAMTVGEIRDALRELRDLEGEIDRVRAVNLMNARRVASGSRAATRPRTSERSREVRVGNRVMPVLAAALCLFGLGVFVLSFWGVISSVSKFGLIFVAGVVLTALGFWRVECGGPRPFWFSVAGLGSGAVFVDAVAGCLAWGLYDPAGAVVALLVWFAVNFALAIRRSAGPFYVVAYVGGLVALWLAAVYSEQSGLNEVFLAGMLAVMFALGRGTVFVRRSAKLGIATTAFSCAAVLLLWESLLESWSGARVLDGVSNLTFFAVPLVLTSMMTVCLFDTRWMFRDFKRQDWICVLVVFVDAMVLSVATRSFSSAPETVAAALVVMILAFCGVGATPAYWLGAALPLVVSASVVSDASIRVPVGDGTASCGALLPALLVLCLASRPFGLLRDWRSRLGVVAAYLITVWSAVVDYSHVASFALCAATSVALVVFLVVYWSEVGRESVVGDVRFDALATCVLPGVIVFHLVRSTWFPPMVPFVVVTLGLCFYGAVYVVGEDGEPSPPVVLWHVARFLTYVFVVAGAVFDSGDVVDRILVTACLMGQPLYDAWRLSKAKNEFEFALFGFFSNAHLFILSELWDVSEYRLSVGLVGLVLCAVLIAFGFATRSKSLRKVGLVCSILYVVKMAVFDLGSSYGVGSALMFVVAGVVCFGISVMYNKLDKLYGADADVPVVSDDDESDA